MTDQIPPPVSLYVREFAHTLPIIASPVRRVSSVEGANGNGQPILIFPGILSNDLATSLMRRSFAHAGYHAHSSKLGFVTGVTPKSMAQAEARLTDVFEREERKLVLLGWSLGGIYSRVLAQRQPDKVAMVVTMGSPFSGDRRANNAWRIYEALNDHKVDAPNLPDDPSAKPPMHTVAVWSPNDGIIAPPCAKGLPSERDVEVEVPFKHFAYGSGRSSIEAMIKLVGEQLPRQV